MKRKVISQSKKEVKKLLAESIYNQIMNLDFDDLDEIFEADHEVISFKIIPSQLGYAVQKSFVIAENESEKELDQDFEAKLNELLTTELETISKHFDA